MKTEYRFNTHGHGRRLGALLPALAIFAGACMADSHTSPVGTKESALTGAECGYFDVNGTVNICHATQSAKNPFVMLKIPESGCVNGHSSHPNDFIDTMTPPTCGAKGCLPPTAPCDPTLPCCDGLTCDPTSNTCVCPVAGTTFCADVVACVNLQTDVSNCGACGTVCGAGSTCTNGQCVATCPPPPPPLCQNDLSNVGTGDFQIQLTVNTTYSGFASALINQRPICGAPESLPNGWWELRTLNGSLFFEVGSGGYGSRIYTSLVSGFIADGNTHSVVVERTAGVLTLAVDCQVRATGNSNANLGQLAPVPVSASMADGCAGAGGDGTVSNQSVITGVCVSH